LAAKAGCGQIFGLSWPPILFLGTKSPAFGRQSCLGGIFLAVLASKTASRFRQTKFDGEEWIADLAMDSFGR
jgi:hypothetical protein